MRSSRWISRALGCAVAAANLLFIAGCDRRPDACAVRGIDVSGHQGDIDWDAVAASGIVFAWIKATEGGDFADARFRRNWSLAAAAGVKRGAYHFVTWCRPARDQAAWFVANVAADPDALPPVLDVEWNPASRSCARHAPRDEALATMQVILAAMEKAYGKVPVIYAPLDFYDKVMRGALDRYPLWARSLGDPPSGYGDRPGGSGNIQRRGRFRASRAASISTVTEAGRRTWTPGPTARTRPAERLARQPRRRYFR